MASPSPLKPWARNLQCAGFRLAAIDVDGRPFHARGEAVNRTFINRHTFIDINSIIEWQLEGVETPWWGEDQDMWPVHQWAADSRSRGRR